MGFQPFLNVASTSPYIARQSAAALLRNRAVQARKEKERTYVEHEKLKIDRGRLGDHATYLLYTNQ
jgi:hypothetical protein